MVSEVMGDAIDDALEGDEEEEETEELVNQVLDEIGANEVPILQVYNKIDALPAVSPFIERDENEKPISVYLSAKSGLGVDLLHQAICERLRNTLVTKQLLLPPTSGQIYAQFYQHNCIKQERFNEFGDRLLTIEVDEIQWQKWLKQYPQLTEYLEFAQWA